MTSEIKKFRAWDSFNKKMSFWTMNDLCNHMGDADSPSALEEWMQYTGLKDKNGEEIWEGDLATDAHDEHYEVVFSDASFAVVHDGNVIEPLYEVASGIEIIGKIYENPELLTN